MKRKILVGSTYFPKIVEYIFDVKTWIFSNDDEIVHIINSESCLKPIVE